MSRPGDYVRRWLRSLPDDRFRGHMVAEVLWSELWAARPHTCTMRVFLSALGPEIERRRRARRKLQSMERCSDVSDDDARWKRIVENDKE